MSGRLLAVCTLLWLPFPVLAAGVEFRAGGAVTVAADEVIEGDLYASGDTVTIAGVVRGDVVAAAREVTLTGRVEEDFIAAGQVIDVRGAVGDDMRVAGMVLRLGPEGSVMNHVVSAGYSIAAETGSRVGGEFVFSGAKALLAGDLEAGLRVTATALEIAGYVAEDVEVAMSGAIGQTPWFERFVPISVPTVADGLTVTDSARIGGRLAYTAPVEGEIPAGAVGGGVEWDLENSRAGQDAVADDRSPTLLSRVGDAVRRFFAILIVGLLLLWRAPRWTSARIDEVASSPLRGLGWGLASSVGAPVTAFVILTVTILLANLAGILSLGRLSALVVLLGLTLLFVLVVGFLITVLFGAPIVVGSGVGRALLQRIAPARLPAPYLSLAVGLALLVVLTSLPIVGRAIGLAAVVLGLGLVAQWLVGVRIPDRQIPAGRAAEGHRV